MAAEDAQERAVQQRPGHQGRDERRGLAVGVGQPGVQRGEPGLRPEPDEEEHERDLQDSRRNGPELPQVGPPVARRHDENRAHGRNKNREERRHYHFS